MKSTRGLICPKRSSTPLMPKSGEQEDQVAPMLAAASMAIMDSGMFGMKPATRSPGWMPIFFSAAASLATA